MHPAFSGVLFFPVTPFTESGEVDVDKLAQHVAKGTDAGPGGVFIACGTGEFHAIDSSELRTIVRTAVDVVGGRVPVYAGAGGSIAQAKTSPEPPPSPAPTGCCSCRRTWWRCRRPA